VVVVVIFIVIFVVPVKNSANTRSHFTP